MDNLLPLLSLTRLAARFDYISTAVIAAVAKLDPQNGIAPSSHVVLVTCVKYLYRQRWKWLVLQNWVPKCDMEPKKLTTPNLVKFEFVLKSIVLFASLY